MLPPNTVCFQADICCCMWCLFPFFVSKLDSYPHAALQEKPSSQFSKALLKRQAWYRSLGHLIHPALGWHSPPRDPIRKEGQTNPNPKQPETAPAYWYSSDGWDSICLQNMGSQYICFTADSTLLSNLVVYLKLKRRSAFYPGIKQQRSVTQHSN